MEFSGNTQVYRSLKFEQEYMKVKYMQKTTLANYTDCHQPCSYTKYQLNGDPIKVEEITTKIVIMLSSSDVAKRTEEFIYPIESFVSEFGGALGLFLGVSFVMIWDSLEIFIKFGMQFKVST